MNTWRYGLLPMIQNPAMSPMLAPSQRPARPIARRLPRSRKILFTAVTLAILLLISEAGARVWLYVFAAPENYSKYAVPSEFPTAAKYVPHHYLCYALQPGYRKGGTSHNSLGYRGKEFPIKKPAGRVRIVVLGGSTTYGEFIADDDKTFPAQLERMLREKHGHPEVEVINAGCPGYNSWESLANLEFRALDLAPDIVIPYEGVNDVHARLVHPAAYRGDNSGRRTLWADPVEVRLCRHSCLARIVGHHLGLWRLPGVDSFVQAATSDPGVMESSAAIGGDPMSVIGKNPPTFFKRNLVAMTAVARSAGARVMLATWAHSPECGDYASSPHYEKGFAENNAVVRAVAREQRVPILDFAPAMPTARAYWRDGRHVNEKGALLQAELFADFLIRSGLLASLGPTS